MPAAAIFPWIPTTDVLPDDDQTVLIHAPACDPDVTTGYKDGEAWRNAHGEAVTVTHWHPMPTPPSPALKARKSAPAAA